MAFSDFKYPEVAKQFDLVEDEEINIFANVVSVEPTPYLKSALDFTTRLGVKAHSEAARSTYIVGPVLADVWSRFHGRLNLNVGTEFIGDESLKLRGYCDFIMSRGAQRSFVTAPVIMIFEAKRDSIPDGTGQCIAGMLGAQSFNLREGNPIDTVYGAVTTGTIWQFMSLKGKHLVIDEEEYLISDIEKILGILVKIVEPIASPISTAA